MSIVWNTGLAARAQRDAAQFNLKLKKNKKKSQAASVKHQAASAIKKTKLNSIKNYA